MESLSFELTLREGGTGRTFDVVIIAAGDSLNALPDPTTGEPVHVHYPDELLSSAATIALFEGAAVNAHRFGEELDHILDDAVDKSRFSLNTVGVLEGVHYGEGALRARLVLHEGVSAKFVAGLLKLSVERESSLVGLSIDAKGDLEFTTREGRAVAAVTRFAPGPTVDIVSRPAAGGAIVRLAASFQEEPMTEKPKEPQGGDSPAAAKVPAVDMEKLRASVAAQVKDELKAEAKAKRAAAKKAEAEIRESAEKAGVLLEATLKDANLTESAAALVRSRFEGSTFKEADLTEEIANVRKLLTEADRSGEVSLPDLKVGTESRDRIDAAWQYEFRRNGWRELRESAAKDLREAGADPIRSFLGFHREVFGVDLQKAERDVTYRRRMTESMTTASWDKVFGDNLGKAMIAFTENPEFSSWREIATIENLSSYETQHRIRSYGFGNLPTVAEGANYTALTSPGDDEETYAATKKGGTEDITEEMILADRLGQIAAIPMKLGTAAARTLYEAVWDNLTYAGQPDLGDGNALFYARTSPNANTGTTGLSAASHIATRLLMLKFTDTSTSKRLGVTPAYVAVPVDLEDEAYAAFKPLEEDPGGATTDRGFVVSTKPRIITVRHWTNAKDHVFIADKSMVTGIIVGFVGGNEQPQLYTQDNATVGSVFDRDAVTYKIKFPFGVGIGDYRAFFGQDVA